MHTTVCWLTVLTGICFADALTVRERIPTRTIRGAAMANDGQLFTWGDGLSVRDSSLERERLLAPGVFGEGGCLVDFDEDGRPEFVGKEGSELGPLTWRKPPDWKPQILEKETDTHDCLEATLFGRKGVLAIHRHAQLRFYENSELRGLPWKVREIYSIYTASQQTGLALLDIDRDGRLDILCGNYWIQSPRSFDLPWHIFAINTWFEAPESAMHAHTITADGLFVAQAHMSKARAATFSRPADPKQLWTEQRLKGEFHNAHAVISANGMVLMGENNGAASRIFEVRNGYASVIGRGAASLRLFLRADGSLISVGPREIVHWNYLRK